MIPNNIILQLFFNPKPLQPAQNRFVQVPLIVLPSNQTIDIDDRRHQFEEEEYHHKSLNNRPNAMETINGSNEIMENQMNVSNCVPMEASSSMDKSTTMSSETMANVDSNNNNNNNDEMKCQQQDPMCTNVSHDYSIESKPDIFHSKTSQTIRQSHSETRISSSPFQRTNSVPGNTTNRSYSNEPLSPKQPMFASSSFYDPRTHPTIEEQVSDRSMLLIGISHCHQPESLYPYCYCCCCCSMFIYTFLHWNIANHHRQTDLSLVLMVTIGIVQLAQHESL